MVSDSELVEQLREFLRTSDLTTTTNAIVRRKLEEHFGVDLSEKKAFIREQVDLFLQSQLDNDKEEGKEGEEEEEEGDDVAKDEVEGSDGGDGAGESGQEGDEDEEEEGEEEEGTSNGKRKNRSIKSNKLNKDVKKRKGGGFTKVCSLSPQLQNFLGVPELARTEVVKQLWVYIRGNNLQDPGNKRKIICDEKLNELFNVKTIDMFQMNKVLAKHIWPLASEDGPSKPAEKETKPRKEREEGSDELPRKEKRRKGGDDKRETKGGSKGFLAPLQLSDALVKFLGTGESALSRSDVVKRMWEYIKQNNLQNPADKRQIICDEKLNELFGVDSFTGFTVPKLLATHFTKIEQ